MITSRHNSAVRRVREVARKRPQERFLLEGPHLLEEALKAKVSIELLLLSPRAGGDFVQQARHVAERVEEVSEELLAYVADSQKPQGIVAVAVVPTLSATRAAVPLERMILLDEVRDPGNLGTIARTAWAAGASAMILSGDCVDAWNPKCVRASAGALFRLPVLRFERQEAAMDWLQGRGHRTVVASANGATSCFEVDLRTPLTFVLGSEAHGVHADLAARCDASVYIPMADGCESLNLAAASAILLYLALQRAVMR